MLLEHNANVYNDLEQTLANNNCCCVVMGTGVGKTYVATEYLENHDFKALVVSPRQSINKSWEKHTKRVEAITYQKLANIYKDIDYTKYNVLICDEVHHIGAPKWGKPIKYLIDNKIIKVIGLTESSIRYTDGGRDIAEEFFGGNIAFGESVPSAIKKQILNPVTYVGAMYNSDGLKKTLRGKIQSRLYAKLNLALNKTPTIYEILKKHMPKGKRKGIIFASTIDDIQSAIDFIHSVYPSAEIKFVHSKQSDTYNNEAFEWFKNVDEGYLCSVDMISEGVHIKGVNTLIMLRRTESVNLFNQQLGRCLDASSKEPAILFDLVNNKYSIRIVKNKLRIRTNSIFESGKLNVIPSEQLIVKDYTKDIVEVLMEIRDSLFGRWTEYEDNLLKEFFKEHPNGRGLKDFSSKVLPNRTFLAIKSRVHELALNTEWESLPFTQEEDDIIRKFYPIEGNDCCKRMKNRTPNSVSQRASKLKVKNDSYFWTDEDKEIIRKYYPIEGNKIVNRFPGKTIFSIKAQARKMKVYSIYWTKEEDELIKQKYSELGGIGLEPIMPNRNSKEISRRARILGVKRENYRRKIKCVETGQAFKDAREACRVIGITPKHANVNILDVCKGKKGKKTAYGYHWEFVS